jgi:hypothetical protein
MSYIGIGVTNPNHNLEISGQFRIEDVEGGKRSQQVPFEILSDYTGNRTLTDSRQLRLRVTPSETITSNAHIDMGIDNQYGNVFFISQPVFDSTVSGDRVFSIDNNSLLETPNSNVFFENITCNDFTINDALRGEDMRISFIDDVINRDTGSNIASINGITSNPTTDNDNIVLELFNEKNSSSSFNVSHKIDNLTISNFFINYTSNLIYLGDKIVIDNDGDVTTTGYNSFTGAHKGIHEDTIELGKIVSVDSSKKLEELNINQATPHIKLSDVPMDPCVFGVSSGNKHYNAIGDGSIWVSDVNGTFTAGDYITSSRLSGYGQKQNDKCMKNYTVGKILQNCDFENGDIRYLSITTENTLATITKEQYDENSYRAQIVACTYHCG